MTETAMKIRQEQGGESHRPATRMPSDAAERPA